MKLSTKGRYSVTALYELAQHYGQGIVPLKTIAVSQGLSENYLEQLMGTMRKAGLVTSTRGAQGGYELARAPEDITIKVCDSINDVLASITLADLCKGDGRKRMGCAG